MINHLRKMLTNEAIEPPAPNPDKILGQLWEVPKEYSDNHDPDKDYSSSSRKILTVGDVRFGVYFVGGGYRDKIYVRVDHVSVCEVAGDGAAKWEDGMDVPALQFHVREAARTLVLRRDKGEREEKRKAEEKERTEQEKKQREQAALIARFSITEEG